MSKNSSAKPYQDNKSVKDIKTFRNKKKEKNMFVNNIKIYQKLKG